MPPCPTDGLSPLVFLRSLPWTSSFRVLRMGKGMKSSERGQEALPLTGALCPARLKHTCRFSLTAREPAYSEEGVLSSTRYGIVPGTLICVAVANQGGQSMQPLHYPHICVSLVGAEGSVVRILSCVLAAMDAAGVPKAEQNRFLQEATEGTKVHLLQTSSRWVHVVGERETNH